MSQKTEHEIIRGCRKKDPILQKALVVQYSRMLMGVSCRYMKDKESAKDVVQEGLIRILNALPTYQQKGSFEAWMKKIIVNTALSYFDKSCFQKEQSHALESLPQQSVTPEVYEHLAVEELMKIINQLPESFRLIFNLHAIEGFSHKEIAASLCIKESSSRSRLTRARIMLVKLLNRRDHISIRI